MKQTWVVTMFFNRGHVQTFEYEDKKLAQLAIRIAVFINEDCINCTVYRKDTKLLK
jgi:hypothetical protein